MLTFPSDSKYHDKLGVFFRKNILWHQIISYSRYHDALKKHVMVFIQIHNIKLDDTIKNIMQSSLFDHASSA
jgi:hypothetical protein